MRVKQASKLNAQPNNLIDAEQNDKIATLSTPI